MNFICLPVDKNENLKEKQICKDREEILGRYLYFSCHGVWWPLNFLSSVANIHYAELILSSMPVPWGNGIFWLLVNS